MERTLFPRSACQAGEANPAPAAGKDWGYPETRVDGTLDVLHGVEVADPFRWLEDDEAPEVKAWQAAQTALIREYLDAIPGRDEVRARIAEVFQVDEEGTPARRGKHYFQMKRRADQDQPVLYGSLGFPGDQRVLVDPNALGEGDNTVGGLLVGAAMVQRPELFGAVICAVPLLDMLRYHEFLIARLWIPEYGSADDPAQFEYLLAYSPYHNVKDGTRYPATLLLTAESDSRVAPLHARKLAAMLQARTGGDAPIFQHVEAKAGHGQGKPISKRIDDDTDYIAFAMHRTGLLD